ncbi:TIGR04222 domain-containing membrane protein [Streptomyces sp. NPDC086077]|uniref:TIGR04222 domain-containing membrane protein n=1 Tax=Streptomyces sp. NPDC086077 TaxID=3154862 RepID=UPI00341655F0
MTGTGSVRETPHEIALLSGGPRAAVTVAVVALHLRGAVEAGVPGTIRAAEGEAGRGLPALPPPGVSLDAPADCVGGQATAVTGVMRASYLESAVYHCLDEPREMGELVRHADVRWALAEVRVGLAEAGLLRYPLLGPTRAARRRLKLLRSAYPSPTSRRGVPDQDKLIAVALHGEPALRVLVPRFAFRAGLTDRVKITDKDFFRGSPSGGTYGGSGGYLYCGSGGGGGGGGGE